MFQIAIDPFRCVACMMCELACSYHHKKYFDPQISSIEIKMTGKEMILTGIVYHQKSNTHIACDQCKGESGPLCIKYCEWDAIKILEPTKGGA